MKKKFLRYSLSLIKKYHPEYGEDKLAEASYGLEGFYLTITKFIIILLLSILLKITGEMILVLICFNLFRFTAFGLHASKTWICLLSSAIVFLGIPLFIKVIVLPFPIKILASALAFILFYFYAPADTKKRPILKKEKRMLFRYITLGTCLTTSIIACLIKSEIIANAIFCGMYIEIILILPITYHLFHLSYANYKTYRVVANSN